ncbi:hypothetical protein MMC26_003471 [Xylographa opegraphella]|nr:hypothetical protein [Xylographa opegraphella]
MAMGLPAVPSFPYTSAHERSMLGELPVSFKFQPTWGSTIGNTFQRQCEQLMNNFPTDGIFTPMQPRILSYGNCFVGVYVTEPLAARTVPVSESWGIIHMWMLGAMMLYAGAVPAGWSLDLQSGIQICMWHGSLLNLALENPMPSTLRSRTGSLASGLTILATDRHSSGAPFGALLIGMHNYPPLNQPTGVAHMVLGWATTPGIPLADCNFLLRSSYLGDWFLHSGGIFLRSPIVMLYQHCAFGIFFSTPPADGRGRLAAPTGEPSLLHQAWTLMRETTHRGNVVGGYMDLSNGLQIVLYQTPLADPRFLCPLITRVSLMQCLENNLAAARQISRPGASAPAGASAPGGGSAPAGASAPAGTSAPAGASAPAGTSAPAGASTPAGVSAPGGASAPAGASAQRASNAALGP